MTHNKRLTDKLMDIARWYAMPADHFNVVKEAVKMLQDAPSAGDPGNLGYNSVKTELDAISRQAVEDAIYDYSRSCDVNYAQIMEYIDKLPSVSAEKTGRWIEIEHKCHNCKHYSKGDFDGSCGSYICKNYSGWER